MIVSWAEARRLLEARRQPALPFASVDVQGMLEAVRGELFPEIVRVQAFFVTQGPLACISGAETSSPIVFVHEILNTADCPSYVFSLICKHELIHTRVPPVRGGSRSETHPPEFWQVEQSLAPEAPDAWDWIHTRYGDLLLRREQGIYVKHDWKRRLLRRDQVLREAVRRTAAAPPSNRETPAEPGRHGRGHGGYRGVPELLPFRLE